MRKQRYSRGNKRADLLLLGDAACCASEGIFSFLAELANSSNSA